MTQSLNERLKAARMAAGFSKAAHAAQKFEWNLSTYRAHENGQNPFDLATAQLYAKAFDVSLGWLFTGEGAHKPKLNRQSPTQQMAAFDAPEQKWFPEKVQIKGIVGEGYWVSEEQLKPESEILDSSFPPDPRYPANRQFDLKVLGNRALPYTREGELLRCVSIERAEQEMRENDLLVLETHKNCLVERKIRRLVQGSGAFGFVNFDATSTPEALFMGASFNGETISIVGKILFKYEFSEAFASKAPVNVF